MPEGAEGAVSMPEGAISTPEGAISMPEGAISTPEGARPREVPAFGPGLGYVPMLSVFACPGTGKRVHWGAKCWWAPLRALVPFLCEACERGCSRVHPVGMERSFARGMGRGMTMTTRRGQGAAPGSDGIDVHAVRAVLTLFRSASAASFVL